MSAFAPYNTSTVPDVFANARVSSGPIPPSASVAASLVKEVVNPAALTDRLGPVLRNDSGKRVDRLLVADPNTPYMDF